MASKCKCPECGAKVRIDQVSAEKVKCPECGERFRPPVPDDDEDRPRQKPAARRDDDDAQERPSRRPARRGEGDDGNRPVRRGRDHDDEEDDDDRPTRQKKKTAAKDSFSLWYPVLVGVAVIALGGILIATDASTKDNVRPVGPNSPPARESSKPTSRVTAENFLRIKVGLPKSDVMVILGHATKQHEYNSDRHEWHDGDKKIIVVFGRSEELGAPTVVVNKWQEGLD